MPTRAYLRQGLRAPISVRVIGIAVGVALLGGLAIQVVRPSLTHPAVTADLEAPAEVKQILKKSCYDCHSNETRLAWFDEVAPAYWIVVRDVNEARQHLNFSEIAKLSRNEQSAKLFEAVSQVQLGAMPLPGYVRLHPGANVSSGELQVLRNYVGSLAAPVASGSDPAPAANPSEVEPALNGITIPRDYRNWKPVSSTDRFDNGTMRAILGNEIAMQAIAENRMNPWPDGTAFAKVAWWQRRDEQRIVHAGAFAQVEFMIRDRRKFASTKGWGWARWRGSELMPYGHDASFSNECVACHTPVRENDYVFTMPIVAGANRSQPNPHARTQLNREASLEGLPVDVFAQKVITSWIDPRNGTMSTLYGNDIAAEHARNRVAGQPYPEGSALTAVTWKQQEDARWFGGRIPGAVVSVEIVTAAPTYSYREFEGSPLKLVHSGTQPTADGRAAYLLAQAASPMP
ncbi:MAG: heme-binding domain-containing protein [Acidobacteriia bacterium]|nr:heme-binding domain-containing protein [Terriglobia bacterium]